MNHRALLFTILLLIAAVASAQTVVRLAASSNASVERAPVTVSVYVDNVQRLTAASVTVGFNCGLVVYAGAAQGPFLAGAVQFVTPPNASTPDRVKVDQAVLGGGTVSGSGLLFTLTFTPLKAGQASFTVYASSLIIPPDSAAPHAVASASIAIPAFVRCSALLQGAFDPVSGRMGNALNVSEALPLLQPYAEAPWLYDGKEHVARSVFAAHRTIVDWILVEARKVGQTNVASAARAGFVHQDGHITDIDGASPLRFALEGGDYYLVVRHRNHLAVMSREPVAVDNVAVQYDFTKTQAAAFGTEPMSMLASGVYGMTAGDANGDGEITGSDFNLFFPAFRVLQSGYCTADLNLDGCVTGTDFNNFSASFARPAHTSVP